MSNVTLGAVFKDKQTSVVYFVSLYSISLPLSISVHLITLFLSPTVEHFSLFAPALNHLSSVSVIYLFYPAPNPNTIAIHLLFVFFHPFSSLLSLAHTTYYSCSFHNPLFELPHVSVSLLASVPAEWVAGAYSVCPFSSPSFHHCQSTELTWVFGWAGEGWNFVEEAPANLAQNAAFPPNWNPNGWHCFSWELRAMRPRQPPCSAHLSSKLPVPDLNSGWDVWKNYCCIFLYLLTWLSGPPLTSLLVLCLALLLSFYRPFSLSFFLFCFFLPDLILFTHFYLKILTLSRNDLPFLHAPSPSSAVFIWTSNSWLSKITEIGLEVLSHGV